MTREEAWRRTKGYLYDSLDWIKAVEIIEALEQEPCYDAISRQAVLDGIDTYINKAQSTGTQDDFYSFAELVVKELPPVTPKPKIGHWIKEKSIYGWDGHSYQCSECGRAVHKDKFEDMQIDYPYCHCGAKMGEEE